MAVTPGILFVAFHGSWKDVFQLITGKVTLQIDTPLGTFRREYEISAGDVLALAAQVVNLMTTQATAYAVPVKQFSSASVDMLTAATTAAGTHWPG